MSPAWTRAATAVPVHRVVVLAAGAMPAAPVVEADRTDDAFELEHPQEQLPAARAALACPPGGA